MRIGLITDTHVPWVERQLPNQVMDPFEGVDLILHAGDIYSHAVLDQLQEVAPVLACLGDDDYPSSDVRIRDLQVINCGSCVIWMLHEGPPINGTSHWMPRWLKNHAVSGEPFVKPNIIISGHEHRTIIEQTDGLLQINSGSATYLGYKKGLGTIGFLNIDAGVAEVELLDLKTSQKLSQYRYNL